MEYRVKIKEKMWPDGSWAERIGYMKMNDGSIGLAEGLDAEWSLETFKAQRKRFQVEWTERGYYDNRSLSQALIAGCEAFPDVQSIYCTGDEERKFSNRELLEEGLRMAGVLRQLGVEKGDVVAVQLPTWQEAAVLYQAIAHVGAVVLPIITMYGAAEVHFILEQSGAKILFMPERLGKRDFTARVTGYGNISKLTHIVLVRGEGEGAMGWDEFLRLMGDPVTPVLVDANDIALLMYTSGTTSAPKGVLHTHNTLLREWGRPSYKNRGLYLSNLPVGHYTGYGHTMRPFVFGAPMIFLDHWNAKRAARLIEKHRVCEGGGTPLFLLTLLEAAEALGADISSLNYFGLGGQGMTPDLINKALDAGIFAGRIYGLTEHPTVSVCNWEGGHERCAATDGIIDDGNEVLIVDENGDQLPLGVEGDILTRGPEMFVGYLDESLNVDCFLPGCWYRTGDIGRVDADGYITITDRKKDIIIRGGENISSTEVEGVLLAHPDIADAAAVAMPDKIYGERVCAFLVVREGVEVTLSDIVTHFKSKNIGHQKIPERIVIIDDMPRNSSGKIKKFELRNIAKELNS